MITRRVDDGRWREVFAGVYFVGAGEISPVALAHAALLVAPPGSALSHRTAGPSTASSMPGRRSRT